MSYLESFLRCIFWIQKETSIQNWNVFLGMSEALAFLLSKMWPISRFRKRANKAKFDQIVVERQNASHIPEVEINYVSKSTTQQTRNLGKHSIHGYLTFLRNYLDSRNIPWKQNALENAFLADKGFPPSKPNDSR